MTHCWGYDKFRHLSYNNILIPATVIAATFIMASMVYVSTIDLQGELNRVGSQKMLRTATPDLAKINPQEYDAADLVFMVDQLRRTTLSVRGVIMCQSVSVCIMALPWPMDDLISIGLKSLPVDLQKRVVLNMPDGACPARMTGFFDGVHLEIYAVKFSLDPECANSTHEDHKMALQYICHNR